MSNHVYSTVYVYYTNHIVTYFWKISCKDIRLFLDDKNAVLGAEKGQLSFVRKAKFL